MRVIMVIGAPFWDGTGPIYNLIHVSSHLELQVAINFLLILPFSINIRQTTTLFMHIVVGHAIYK